MTPNTTVSFQGQKGSQTITLNTPVVSDGNVKITFADGSTYQVPIKQGSTSITLPPNILPEYVFDNVVKVELI